MTRTSPLFLLSVLLAVWPSQPHAQAVHVALPDTLISADSVGAEVLIPLSVTEVPASGVASFQFGLFADPSVATITGHETAGTLAEEEGFLVESEPDCNQWEGATFCLVAAGSTADPLTETGTFVFLRVAIHAEGTTELTFTWAQANEQAVQVVPADGQLEVAGGISAEEDPMQGRSELSLPSPNPFSGETTLELRLPRGERIQAVAYDALGKAVRELYAGEAEGMTRLSLDGRTLPAGVYVIRVEGESFTETRRVTLLR